MPKPELKWSTINPANLPAPLKADFDAIGAAKARFVANMTAAMETAGDVPPGMAPRFGFNYDKLSFAFEPKREGAPGTLRLLAQAPAPSPAPAAKK